LAHSANGLGSIGFEGETGPTAIVARTFFVLDYWSCRMLPTARKLAFTDVPVIDLAPVWSGDDAARQAVADQIAEVCGRVGFMYVKNHRISTQDIDAIFQTAADFHNLPLDAKMEVSVTKNTHAQGYLHGMTKGVAKNLSENLQEAFQIRRPLADDDPGLLSGLPLHGKIPWPSAMPDLKPRMMAYYEKVDVLGYELLKLFERALQLPEGTLKQFFKKDMNSLRLLHYPPRTPSAEWCKQGPARSIPWPHRPLQPDAEKSPARQ
jgi:isopenicillin N synthase-like dioxygenase